MARGWESKSVEEQQSAVMLKVDYSAKSPMSAEQIARRNDQDALRLSRQRVLQQLQNACNPNHRNMLEKALVDLEARLASFI